MVLLKNSLRDITSIGTSIPKIQQKKYVTDVFGLTGVSLSNLA